MDQEVTSKLYRKVEVSKDLCRILLTQLSDLPGDAIMANDSPGNNITDRRNLSRLLNEAVKNTEFLERWAKLSEEI